MSFAHTERQALSDLFEKVGSDQPTLCGEWTTTELLAHLVVRERHPRAAVGILVRSLSHRHDDAVADLSHWYSFGQLLEQWREGPPRLIRRLEPVIDAVEHFVHHEDVRRAQGEWEPRSLNADAERDLYRALRLMTRRLISSSGATVVFVPESAHCRRWLVGDKRAIATADSPTVTVIGPIGELALWAFDRPEVRVKVLGDADAVVRRTL